MSDESMSILRDGNQDWLPIPLPGAEGVSVRALHPATSRCLLTAPLAWRAWSTFSTNMTCTEPENTRSPVSELVVSTSCS